MSHTGAVILSLDELPISANDFWTPILRVGKPALVRSPAYQNWLTMATWLLRSQSKGQRIEGAFTLDLQYAKPKGKRHADLDNLVPGICDALQSAGVIENDKLLQRFSAAWVTEKTPGVRIFVISTQEVLP